MAEIWAFFKTVGALARAFLAALGLIERAQISQMKKENHEAVQEAIDGDQRKLERDVFRSPTAGKPSGIPGTSIRNDIPDRLSDEN